MKYLNSAKLISLCIFLLSPSLGSAQNNLDSVGLRAEAKIYFGQTHSKQARWMANFAMANTRQLFKYANPVFLDAEQNTQNKTLNYDPVSVMFEGRSPFPMAFYLTSFGDRSAEIFGTPVAAKISPVNTANGKETSWVANPWVWVGAVAVGAAAAGGGGGGGSSSGGSNNQDDNTMVAGQDSGSNGQTVGTDDCRAVDTTNNPNNATVIGGECVE